MIHLLGILDAFNTGQAKTYFQFFILHEGALKLARHKD
jgi:hypothetical protein